MAFASVMAPPDTSPRRGLAFRGFVIPPGQHCTSGIRNARRPLLYPKGVITLQTNYSKLQALATDDRRSGAPANPARRMQHPSSKATLGTLAEAAQLGKAKGKSESTIFDMVSPIVIRCKVRRTARPVPQLLWRRGNLKKYLHKVHILDDYRRGRCPQWSDFGVCRSAQTEELCWGGVGGVRARCPHLKRTAWPPLSIHLRESLHVRDGEPQMLGELFVAGVHALEPLTVHLGPGPVLTLRQTGCSTSTCKQTKLHNGGIARTLQICYILLARMRIWSRHPGTVRSISESTAAALACSMPCPSSAPRLRKHPDGLQTVSFKSRFP